RREGGAKPGAAGGGGGRGRVGGGPGREGGEGGKQKHTQPGAGAGLRVGSWEHAARPAEGSPRCAGNTGCGSGQSVRRWDQPDADFETSDVRRQTSGADV